MRKTFKYRLYPSNNHKKKLDQTLEVCRCLYNQTLQSKINHYKTTGESLSLYDTHKLLTTLKRNDPALKTVYSQVLQETQTRVDLAYRHFFRRVKTGEKAGFPRFKGQNRYDSFTYKQNNGSFRIKDNMLTLSKIGDIKIVLHRPLIGKVKNCIISKSSTGKWYVCFSSEVETCRFPSETKVSVGIDLGIKTFAVLSDETSIQNPRFFKVSERKLARYQRKLSKTKERQKRKKYKKIVSHVHEGTRNKRTDFCHQESRRIVNRYEKIFLEKLNIRSMLKNGKKSKGRIMRKSIHDVAWNQFINCVVYKAEEAGREVKLVNPKNTSKICSRCNLIVEKDLSVRVHNCPRCGLQIDRDLNASLNIMRIGLDSLRRASFRRPVDRSPRL